MYQFNFFVLQFILAAILLLPSLSAFQGFPHARPESLILPIWFIIYLIMNGLKIKFVSGRVLLLSMIFVLLPVSMLNGLINNYSFEFVDFYEYIVFINYFLMYLLSYNVLSKASEKDIYRLFSVLIFCGAIVFLISVSQFFNFMSLNDLYLDKVAPTQADTLLNDYNYPRPVAMMGNPNVVGFAFTLLILALLYSSYVFNSKKEWLFIALFFIGILLTMSRTAILSLIVSLFLFFIIQMLGNNIKNNLKIVFVFLMMILGGWMVVMSPDVYDQLTWRLKDGLNIGSDASFQARVVNWAENLNIAIQHPLIGVGPLRAASFEYSADNEWLLIWRSYGFIGVLWFLLLCIYPFWRKLPRNKRALHISLIVAIFLCMISASVLSSSILFSLVLFLFAIIDTRKNVSVQNISVQK